MSRDGPLIQTEVLGPISRNRISDILLHMKLVSRASRCGLSVGFLRILSKRTCTDQRSKTEGYQQVCRVECPNEFGSLSIVNVFQQDSMFCFGPLHGTCLQNFIATGLR